MWKVICLFELRYQLKQPLFRVSAAIFFLLGLGLASSSLGTAIGEAPGTSLRNAPLLVVSQMPVLSLLGLFVIVAFIANAALRDFERHSDMLFFSKPLGKLDYLGGRFLGSMAVSLLVLISAVLGLFAGNFAPWQPAQQLGPTAITPYLFGLSLVIVPNLLSMGAFFFALAITSRRLTLTYLAVVIFIGGQDAIELAAQSFGSRKLGSLLEPSGIIAIETISRYWTIAEQNSRLPEIGGALLANRLLWLGLAAAVLAICVWRFQTSTLEKRPKRRGKRQRKSPVLPETSSGLALPAARDIALPRANKSFSPTDHWRQLWRQARLEISEVFRSPAFLAILAFGLMLVVVLSFLVGSALETPSYPLTHLMLEAIAAGVRLTLVLILVLYAGELVFNQRALKMSGVFDALPLPNWVPLGAKMMALIAIAGVFMLASALSTLVVQLGRGSVTPDLGLYARGLMVLAWPLVPLIVLAIFLQVTANRKLMGLLLMTLALIAKFALPRLGFEDNLYLFGSHPPISYTAMNGFGHHAEPYAWSMIYWSFAAVILAAATLLLWPRGIERPLRDRLDLARKRLARPVIVAAAVGLVGMLASGGWIFYNRDIRGEYLDRGRILDQLADYERRYSQYEAEPLPRISSVFVELDLYPHRRQASIRGRYRLENQGAQPIHSLPITRSPRWVEGVLRHYGGVSFERLDLPGRRVLSDDKLGFYVFELDRPMAPGESFELEFTVRVDHDTFANRRHNNLLIANGTFFSDRNFLPFIGYARANQLLDPADRAARDLPPPIRSASIDDAAAVGRNYLGADWIQFEAIISTHADQIAIAPGHLEREWIEADRRFFHYKTKAPITNLLPFLSGEFEVMKERWQGIDLEIYFDPEHRFNIERFMATTKKSLAYLTAHFGPYPHDQLRIVEIPRYHGEVAFAFAQTIAYSETWSFTADLDRGKLDWLTGILAHEISHQWWNHQVVPADVQGATFIGESLAQYSAMMILESIYGPETVRRFLKFHLDRYLDGRGRERIGELPLSLVENQGFVHYSKASLAFYALKDQVGEEVVNRALREFLEAMAFKEAPFATSKDLLAILRRHVPASQQRLIDDLFETIVLFDNRIVDASFSERPDGRFLVEVETQAAKLRDDGSGVLTELEIDDQVDIGIFGEHEQGETVLVLVPHHLRAKDGRFSFVVDQRPVRVGIDPYNKLIDLNSEDNLKTLRLRAQ